MGTQPYQIKGSLQVGACISCDETLVWLYQGLVSWAEQEYSSSDCEVCPGEPGVAEEAMVEAIAGTVH